GRGWRTAERTVDRHHVGDLGHRIVAQSVEGDQTTQAVADDDDAPASAALGMERVDGVQQALLAGPEILRGIRALVVEWGAGLRVPTGVAVLREGRRGIVRREGRSDGGE